MVAPGQIFNLCLVSNISLLLYSKWLEYLDLRRLYENTPHECQIDGGHRGLSMDRSRPYQGSNVFEHTQKEIVDGCLPHNPLSPHFKVRLQG